MTHRLPSYHRVRELMKDTPWTPLGKKLLGWNVLDATRPYGLWRK